MDKKVFIKNELMNPDSDYKTIIKDPNLKYLQYVAFGGSHAYGTNTKNSDVDLRGFYMPYPNDILGVGDTKDSDRTYSETDTVFFSFYKFIKLLTQCNPNIVEFMGVRKQDVLYESPLAKQIRENVEMFLSKRAFVTFAGYATQQLRRLENALARDSYPQAEKENHILKSLEAEMLAANDVYKLFDKDNFIKLYLDDSLKEDYEQEIHMNLNLKHVPLRDFVSLRNSFSNMLKNYGKIRHRNNKKDEDHLYKHAMHLIRLYYMGIDILENHEIITYREKEHVLLMEIRHGAIPLDKIFDLQRKLEIRLQEARDKSTLPLNPDYDKINKFVIDVGLDFIRNEDKYVFDWKDVV